MIISHYKKFIFIHLEKCGGTSVETALEPHLDWKDIILGSTEFGEKIQTAYFDRYGFDKVKKEMLWKHSNAKNIFNFLGQEKWQQYKRLSVVREPVDLISSLYWFSNTAITYHLGHIDEDFWRSCFETKIFPNEWPYREKYVQVFVASQINHSGFDGFVSSILKNGGECVSPQVKRLKTSYFDKDFGKVVDLSQLNNEWQSITDYLELPQIDLNKLNASQYKEEVDISKKTLKMIRRHFSLDYKLLSRYTGVDW
jgi:hypothetical protein